MFAVETGVAKSSDMWDQYVSDSNECVKFKLVTCFDDLKADFVSNEQNGTMSETEEHTSLIEPFKPEMSYQFFGENENIFGYTDLCVKIYYSCAKLNIYMGLQYHNMVKKDQTDGVEADDVLKLICSKYETNVFYNLNEFSLTLAKEKSFTPYGKLENEFEIDASLDGCQSKKRHFFIYKAHSSDPGFVAYHERMQTFLLWFIEAVSYIDIDDDRWDFFVLYERISLDNSNEFQYCFVGYSTIYRYYAYPNNVRPRISQFIILPPFQRLGLGTKLLETIYSHYNNSSTVDITVEDPSENFQRMRDILNCKMCLQLESFSSNNLKKGWSKEMASEAQKKYKFSAKQTRRIYEILRLKFTDRTNADEYRDYRLFIKQRLNAPYHKQIYDIERLRKKKLITEANYATLMKANQVPREYRTKLLSTDYDKIEEEYKEIIEKL